MTHQDFRYEGLLEQSRPEAPRETSEPKSRSPREVARAAASLCWKIRNTLPDPVTWKGAIEAADPDLRECLRELLKQSYREMQERKRLETVGKRSEAGDAAVRELARRYGNG